MFDFLYNPNKVKNWQVLIFMLMLNELLLLLVYETFDSRLVIGGFSHMSENSADLELYKNPGRIIYNYALIFLPLIICLKYILLGLFLQMPFILQSRKMAFRKSLRVAMVASISQILLGVARFQYYLNEDLDHASSGDLHKIPLSIASLFETTSLNQTMFFLINQFNVFEILWCFLIYKGLLYYQKGGSAQLKLLVPLIWLTLLFIQFLLVLLSYQLIGI